MLKDTATVEMLCSADAELETLPGPGASMAEGGVCFHCGTLCRGARFLKDDKEFCCQGCLTVFELLTENGLDGFYQFGQTAGIRGGGSRDATEFRFADELPVRERLVDFSDARLTRVTFHLPAIHCIACVWLLENLFRLNPAIGHSQVNFPRKEAAICFETAGIKLSEVISLLTSLGYPPEFTLSDVSDRLARPGSKRLWLQLGIAGFAFGNTMLFSIASYLGMDSVSGPAFQSLVGPISLLLAIPVVAYSALDYWRSAWASLGQRLLNIEVPIALGIFALFVQSSYEVYAGKGVGYFDSLSGLLFLLLCGRLFQQKTFDRLAFDRDYRWFFPLSVKRLQGRDEESVAVSQLSVGDRLLIRNGELIPADSRLLEGPALIDYSFVTGESEPVSKSVGEYLYAGGRQMGGALQVQMVKPVSQSYLTSLWNQEAFQKTDQPDSLNTLTNRYSQRFTKLVLGIALGAALFWAFANPALALKSFVAVLIVACPCALALAAPFALGTAQRLLAKRGVFLRNSAVLERLAAADAIVFDKTGTLTSGTGKVRFHGPALSTAEVQWIRSAARHSTHPLAVRLEKALGEAGSTVEVQAFCEFPGGGITAQTVDHEVSLGSAEWLSSKGVRLSSGFDENRRETALGPGLQPAPLTSKPSGSVIHVAIDGQHRGWFELASAVRAEVERLMASLAPEYQLSLLSGDNDRDQQRFSALFGSAARMHFNQRPLDKLEFVKGLQAAGRSVVMVGDGLNDAGALQQSDVGVAVVESLSAFSPASDVILAAEMVPQLNRVARFAKSSVRVVRASFLVSALYNVIGISIAARGLLAPVVCAVLMPLSSVTVVAIACGVTAWLGGRLLPDALSGSRPGVAGEEEGVP